MVRQNLVATDCTGFLLVTLLLTAVMPEIAVGELTPACDSAIYCHGELLDAVQMAHIFNDSKTFVDMQMRYDPDEVLSNFTRLQQEHPELPAEAVRQFVADNFLPPGTELDSWRPGDWKERPAFLDGIRDPQLREWGKFLNDEWEELGREVKPEVTGALINRTSLVPVPNPFIIPGGRFREYYYWDTYWIVEGLLVSEMTDTVKDIIGNFIHLVEKFGFVPNGGRVYFTRRSQPPFLIPMVWRYVARTNDTEYAARVLDVLDREYDFWTLNRTSSVRQGDREYVLSRYDVDIYQARPETWREDTLMARELPADERPRFHSAVAAGAESGWDFTARWFAPGNQSMVSIQTGDVYPVDLNALLCGNARKMEALYRMTNGDAERIAHYASQAAARQSAIDSVLWSEEVGAWRDYDANTGASRDKGFYVSDVMPLYTGCAGAQEGRGDRVLQYLQREGVLEHVGGVPSSVEETGEQWDFPNAWPPLQEIMMRALLNVESERSRELARDLVQRWVTSNWRAWRKVDLMYEKYDATVSGDPGRGGEYPVQAGFGWTNGVILQMLEEYGDTLRAEENSAATASVATTGGLIALSLLLSYHYHAVM